MKTTTFATLIDHHAYVRPDSIAIVDYDISITYRQLAAMAVNASVRILQMNRPCAPVVVIGENSWRTCVLYAAAMWAGLPFVPINNRLTASEIERILDILECPRAYTDDMKLIESSNRYIRLDSLIESVSTTRRRKAPRNSGACNCVLFTSGTSGTPKGVMLSHENVLSAAANAVLHQSLDPSDVVGVALPLFHTAALHGQLTPAWYAGACVKLLGRWDPDAYAFEMDGSEVTARLLLPQQWVDVLERYRPTRASRLRLPIAAGGSLGSELLESFQLKLGGPPAFLMGMTEVSPQMFYMSQEETGVRDGFVGRPTTWSSVDFRPPRQLDARMPQGYGEICYSGPLVFQGYWGDPTATKDSFDDDGFFRGGDVAYVDSAGYVRIVDRLKDVVRSGGETVYTGEVEAVLVKHPEIAEIAVVGLPHPKWGEGVTAVVVAAGDHPPTLEKLQEFCRGQLAGYKKPVTLIIVDSLPRNSTGKVLKRDLRSKIYRDRVAGVETDNAR